MKTTTTNGVAVSLRLNLTRDDDDRDGAINIALGDNPFFYLCDYQRFWKDADHTKLIREKLRNAANDDRDLTDSERAAMLEVAGTVRFPF